MKNDSWRDELIEDVMAEAATPSFREGSLDQLLGAATQRRVRRRRNRALMAASCFVAAIGLAAWQLPIFKPSKPTSVQSWIVHSGPLDGQMIVTTQPGLVTTITSSGLVARVEPNSAGKLFELIDDDTLLALIGDRPAGLVNRGAANAELVLLNPADSKGFLMP
jgi:hypothetical protein